MKYFMVSAILALTINIVKQIRSDNSPEEAFGVVIQSMIVLWGAYLLSQ